MRLSARRDGSGEEARRLPDDVERTGAEGAPKLHRLRLIVMRHAESVETPTIRDYDKPLLESGRAHASSVAAQLDKLGWHPQLVLSSDAKRSRETIEAMLGACDSLRHAAIKYYGSLYTMAALDGECLGHLKTLLLEEATDAMNTVLCVGHNKGWEEAASTLSGQPVRLKNACAALLETRATSWADALGGDEQRTWALVNVVGGASSA